MRNQARIIEDLRRCCMVRGVDVLPEGHLRVETKFLYPDGSFVDVFVVDDPHEPRTLSDFAQTTAFLLDNNVKPWASPKRRAQLADVLSLYGVERRGGELCLDFDPQNTAMLGERVIVLGQACLRMSDFTGKPPRSLPKVHDLESARRPEQRVTLVDDAEGALSLYRQEDLRRIEQYSDVVLFSERATVRDRLAA